MNGPLILYFYKMRYVLLNFAAAPRQRIRMILFSGGGLHSPAKVKRPMEEWWGGRIISSRFMVQKLEKGAGLMGLLARTQTVSYLNNFIIGKFANITKPHDNNTHESSESAVFQARDNPHSINSVLKLCVTLRFTVSVAQLSDQDIEENHYNHRHVG